MFSTIPEFELSLSLYLQINVFVVFFLIFTCNIFRYYRSCSNVLFILQKDIEFVHVINSRFFSYELAHDNTLSSLL